MAEDVSAVAIYQQLLETKHPNGRLHPGAPRAGHAQGGARHAATGVGRLDDLLGGGLPAGSATLLYGPPFTGKDVLECQFFLRGLHTGQVAVFILTDVSAAGMMDRLGALAPDMERHLAQGTAHFVDAYSRLIGDDELHPGTHFIDDLRNLSQIVRVVEKLDAQLRTQGRSIGRLVIQSLSTIMMESGSAECFRFLRTMVGRVARRGGTIVAGLEAGMHSDPDVQALKHLCTGMIQTKEADDKFFLRIEGLPTKFTPGWVEYEFSPQRIELTGSFSSERIRGTALTP